MKNPITRGARLASQGQTLSALLSGWAGLQWGARLASPTRVEVASGATNQCRGWPGVIPTGPTPRVTTNSAEITIAIPIPIAPMIRRYGRVSITGSGCLRTRPAASAAARSGSSRWGGSPSLTPRAAGSRLPRLLRPPRAWPSALPDAGPAPRPGERSPRPAERGQQHQADGHQSDHQRQQAPG